MALDLRQVEVRAGAARELLLRVVEHEEREVEDAAGDALAVDRHVLLVEVPAARADLQRRDLVVELVALRSAGDDCSNDSVRRIAWPMLIWPWIWFVHNGEFESSKSVMYESAPELKALMTILASTGPVISTRRQCSAGGTGAIFQSPARIAAVAARKSGRSPASRRLARSTRAASSSLRRGSNARCSLATSASAGGGEHGLEAGQDRRVDRHSGGQGERHGEGPWEAKKSSTSVSFVPMRVGRAPSSSSGRPKRLIQRVV